MQRFSRKSKLILSTAVGASLAASRGSFAASVQQTYTSGTYTTNFGELPYASSPTTPAADANATSLGSNSYIDTVISAFGTPYSAQNSNLSDSSFNGWSLYNVGGTSTTSFKTAVGSPGTVTTGSFYSFGTSNSNQALGVINTGTNGQEYFGVEIANTTGSAINQLVLSFTDTLWKSGAAKPLNFGYYVDNSSASADTLATVASTLTAVSSSSFGATQTVGAAGSSQNFTPTISLSSNPISTSGSVWLVWDFTSTTGSSQGIGLSALAFAGNLVSNPTDVWTNAQGNLIWDTNTSANWTVNSVTGQKFNTSDNVQFTSAAAGAITIAAAGVSPSSTSVTDNANQTYTFTNTSGAIGIAGVGGLTMNGSGTLVLTSQNTYSGNTTLGGGTVSISNDNALGNGGNIVFNGGTLKDTGGITSTRGITVTGGGTFDTGSNTSTLNGNFTGTGTFAKVGLGTLILGGTAPGGNLSVLAGKLVLNESSAPTITADTTGTAFTGNLVLPNATGIVFNSGKFSGGGQVQIQATGASLTSGSASAIVGNAVILNSTNTTPNTTGNVAASTYTPDTFVTNIGASSGKTLEIDGNLSGSAGVNLASGPSGGAGALILGGSNSYTGSTQINSNGTIQLTNSSALPPMTDLIADTATNGSATLDLNGTSPTIASLSDGASVTSSHWLVITDNATNAPSTLTVGGSVVPANAFEGTITNGSNGGVVSLIKNGSNALALDHKGSTVGLYNYSGTTTVNGGTLTIKGGAAITGTGAVSVTGGTLGGSGAVDGAVTVGNGLGAGGTISPGSSSVGSFTVANSVTMNSDGTLLIKIQQPTPSEISTVNGTSTAHTTTEGGDNDTLVLTGNSPVFNPMNQATGATLQVMSIGSFTQMSNLDFVYTIVDATANSGTGVNGTFSHLGDGLNTVASSSSFTDGGLTYNVIYGSNTITLDVTSVPEPSSIGLLAIGGAAMLRRRRRH